MSFITFILYIHDISLSVLKDNWFTLNVLKSYYPIIIFYVLYSFQLRNESYDTVNFNSIYVVTAKTVGVEVVLNVKSVGLDFIFHLCFHC